MDEHLDNILSLFAAAREKIKEDWQLQASVVGFGILVFLLILINIEWRKHGSNLMNLDLDNHLQQDHVVSSERVLKMDSFNQYDYEKIQQFPDEDPLTFVKKRN